jgi:hypothetical protein
VAVHAYFAVKGTRSQDQLPQVVEPTLGVIDDCPLMIADL